MPRRHDADGKIFLLHPTRRTIYRIICENPGTYFYRLMTQGDEKFSNATLLHHLSKLEDDGLIKSEKIDGRRIFFPKNLRSKEIERAFMLLKNKNALKIFLYIINHENCFQNEIAREMGVHHDTVRHHVTRLVDAGLIFKEKQGRKVIFREGSLGEEILEGSMSVFSEAYIRFIVSKLADHCHFPEIVSRSRDQLVIRVVCPHEDDIELSLDISGWSLPILEDLDESKKDAQHTNKKTSETSPTTA